MNIESSIGMTSGVPSIKQFYAGKSVFITGGTGFLGKVFIEKLLYACPGIKKIYMLVRDKKGLSAKTRTEFFFDQPLFSRLKNKRPESLDKIIPITGDLTAPGLGIKPEDEAILIEEVSIVIHSAATVRFDEPIKLALKINFEGTQQVLFLCKQLKKVQVNKRVIKEVVYPPPAALSDAYKFAEIQNTLGLNPEEIKNLFRKYDFLNVDNIEGHPNSYTFTKALTETWILENHGDIPTVIVRPSIVSASYHEPVEGWLDNWNGATGLFTAIGKGALRALFGRKVNIVDLVPVDYVCNLTLAAAAVCFSSDKVKVYNCGTSCANPLKLGVLTNEIVKNSLKHGFNDLPYPTCYLTQSKWTLGVITFLMQTFPAFLADMWLVCTGKEAKYQKIQSQVIFMREALGFFSSQSWEIHSENTLTLFASLSPSDQELFHFDLTDIVWRQYIATYMSGISTYLLKKKLYF